MSILRAAWRRWKRIGQWLGDMVARVVLTVFYFTVYTPFGLGVRLWADPLDLAPRDPPHWRAREPGKPSLEKARKLY